MTVEVAEARTCTACGTALSIDGDSDGRCPACRAEVTVESPPQRTQARERVARAAEVLDTLVDARLLTSYEVPTGDDAPPHHRIEIVHESLLSHWPRLVRWQMQDAEGAKLRDELRAQARLWDEHDRSPDYLWTGTAYREYELWRGRYPGGLSGIEEAFAAAMSSLAERQKRRRRLTTLAILTLALLIALITGSLWQRSEAEARRAGAANLFSLAQLQLDSHPSAAVAYAIASLELADGPEARQLAVEALWKGPTELRLRAGGFLSVDFSPDGRWLATADCKIWPSNGGPPKSLANCDSGAEGFFSPRGDLIAYFLGGTKRSRLGIWSYPEARFLRTLSVGDLTTSFQFTPGGERIITTTEFGEEGGYGIDILSWLVMDGSFDRLARIEIPDESLGAFAGTDPTASRLAWTEGNKFNLADLQALQRSELNLATLEHDHLVSMSAFDRQGLKIATWDKENVPRIWQVATEQAELVQTLRPIDAPTGLMTPRSLQFDSTGSLLGHSEGLLWHLDGPPSARPQSLRRASGAIEDEKENFGYGLAFHPNGKWVATGHRSSVSLWPLARLYPFILAGHEDALIDVEFTSDGNWLVSTSTDGSVRLWPLDSGFHRQPRVLYQAEGQWEGPRRLAVAPDGSFAAIGDYYGHVRILPLDGSSPQTLSGFNDVVPTVAVGPQAQLVAAGSAATATEDATVRVWDLDTGGSIVLDDGLGLPAEWLGFENRETLLVSNGSKIKRWQISASEPRIVNEIEIGRGGTSDRVIAEIRPDLGLVLSVDAERQLWIDDLEHATTRQLASHGNWVATATFDPTGTIVASADKLGVVRVGRLDGNEPHLLLGHEGEINHVVFSPDGQWIATGADDMLIYLWPMPDLDRPPLHTLPRAELLAKLRTLTNLTAVEVPDSPNGWKLEIGPFPGWEEVPTW